MKQAKKILNEITNYFTEVENKPMLLEYIFQSMYKREKITFYNWECPPRTLVKIDGKKVINYDVELAPIFRGEKIDEFTEIPRVVTENSKEKQILNFLGELGISFRFVKFIADTNIYYLTPESLDYLDKKKSRQKFEEFANLIREKMRDYPCESSVILFSKLVSQNKVLYENAFDEAINLLDKGKLVKKQIFEEQLKRTSQHVGLKEDENKIFSVKTIASYAAEGIMLGKISKDKALSNCVWLNIEETDERALTITNCLREKRKIGKIPAIILDSPSSNF